VCRLRALLEALREEFFCRLYGTKATRYRHERHPSHGETANGRWKLAASAGRTAPGFGGAHGLACEPLDVRGVGGSGVYVNTGDNVLNVRTTLSLISPNNWSATLFVDNLNKQNGATPFIVAPDPDSYGCNRPRTVGV